MHDNMDSQKSMTPAADSSRPAESPRPAGAPHVEVWMRGPVPGVPPLLQPVAHSLMQCREEIAQRTIGLSVAELWVSYGGSAMAGFHLRHAAGALGRLLTYARDEQLSPDQIRQLAGEALPDHASGAVERLAAGFDAAVERALAQVRATDEQTLLDPREVGRERLPSTVIGVLVHAAEHTQRHVGQFASTIRLIRGVAAGGSGARG